MTEVGSVIYCFWLVVLVSVGIPAWIAFIANRNESVVRVRGFWSVIIHTSALWGWGIVILSHELTNTTQSPTVFCILLYTASLFLMERALMLFVSFRISAQSVQRAQDKFLFESQENSGYKSLDGRLPRWLLAHRKYFHHGLFSYSKLTAFALVIIWTLPSTVFEIQHSVGMISMDELSQIVLDIVKAFYFLQVVLMSVCWYLLKPVHENFFIKDELRDVAVMTLITIGLLGVFSMFGDWFNSHFYVILSTNMIVVCWELWVSLIRVALLAKKQKSKSQLDSSTARPSTASENGGGSYESRLQAALHDELMYGKFEKFLVREFAVENLLFWKAVQNFKAKFVDINQNNLKAALKAATMIFEEFCAESSQMSVNISSPCREDLKRTFKSQELVSSIECENGATIYIKVDTFDVAVQEVLTILAMDSFRRFQRQELKTEATQVQAAVSVVVAE
eukprot:TRINITY_DN11576_c0_g1_i1.p1 TRINITY_DN11576_c0_g1~~TRINITY_DN11576_c0_g1_i1.p1  ORF type:complete len:458 (-),score=124.09 TRINITY_DN11576_c0_g1_i1:174-1526(-)